ncbi:MAG: DUF5666 domain-containing protein [Proteobacteria bacterium]|nr:DUF5666 domain-containing protein [Pseudomonadota bacterium]
MSTKSVHGRYFPALAAILILGFTTVAEAQQGKRPPTVNFRGQVTAFDGGMLTIKSLDGDTISMTVPKKARVSSLTRVDFTQLKKGDFIASAGMRQMDGKLRAIDVRIFPAKGRHPREVHRKYRLGPESTMTNATVDAFVGGVDGRNFKVKYKGGEQIIAVTDETFVMRQNPGKTNLLKPGANVSIVATKGKDGKITVVRIAVGMKGLVPPT